MPLHPPDPTYPINVPSNVKNIIPLVRECVEHHCFEDAMVIAQICFEATNSNEALLMYCDLLHRLNRFTEMHLLLTKRANLTCPRLRFMLAKSFFDQDKISDCIHLLMAEDDSKLTFMTPEGQVIVPDLHSVIRGTPTSIYAYALLSRALYKNTGAKVEAARLMGIAVRLNPLLLGNNQSYLQLGGENIISLVDANFAEDRKILRECFQAAEMGMSQSSTANAAEAPASATENVEAMETDPPASTELSAEIFPEAPIEPLTEPLIASSTSPIESTSNVTPDSSEQSAVPPLRKKKMSKPNELRRSTRNLPPATAAWPATSTPIPKRSDAPRRSLRNRLYILAQGSNAANRPTTRSAPLVADIDHELERMTRSSPPPHLLQSKASDDSQDDCEFSYCPIFGDVIPQQSLTPPTTTEEFIACLPPALLRFKYGGTTPLISASVEDTIAEKFETSNQRRFAKTSIYQYALTFMKYSMLIEESLIHFDYLKLRDYFDKLPTEVVRHSHFIMLKARMIFAKGDYSEAYSILSDHRKKHPHSLDGVDIFSTTLWQLQKNIELSALAQDLTNQHRDSAQAWLVAANCMSLEKQHLQALECVRRAIRLKSDYYYAFVLMGHELVELDDSAGAKQAFREAIKLNPSETRGYYGLAMVFFKGESYQMAERQLRIALELCPQNVTILCQLAIVSKALNKRIEARFYLETAISLEPSSTVAKFHLAKLQYESGEYDTCIQVLEELKTISPDEAQIFFLLGKAYRRRNFTQHALVNFNWAAEMDPRGEQTMSYLHEHPYEDESTS